MQPVRILAVLLACGACGTDVRPAQEPVGDPAADEVPEGYTRLIGRTWSVPPGAFAEYRCARLTVPHDMYLTSITALAPPGTHHVVLSLAGTNGTAGPDGDQDDCGVGTLGMVMLFASGVGTAPLVFPDDVGVAVRTGDQLHLNIHLANSGDQALTGETVILVRGQTTPPPVLAEMVFAGTYDLALPPTGAPHDVVGGCTATRDYAVFAVWPHMHQLGVHQRLEIVSDGRAHVVHDAPFDFEEQNHALVEPSARVRRGDEVRVTCTFVNDTGAAVGWGDGAHQEMCFAGLYRYPALGEGLYRCTDRPDQ